ncbi:hypothetical protein [Lactococcus formosensis]|uniref:hypothetical protein n=1 Tax=Lactococcus formosensis TaxID=1281486 RepID=UPI00254F3CFB|nr:hypothetical protein [Lactococcus formosensis]
MAYLTFDEYTNFGYEAVTSDEFDRLVVRASDVVDVYSRQFYKFHELDTDVDFRKNQFKKAIAVQLEYMATIGAISTAEINNPTSWSLDGISVSNGNNKLTDDGTSISLISQDALEMLSETGLLYRGVCS